MRKQRGITTGWILAIVVAIIAILALIVMIEKEWAAYTAKLDKNGYDRGTNECDAAYKGRDNQALKDANALITKLRDEALAKESATQKQFVAVDGYYQGVIKNGKAAHDADVAAIRAGTLGMFYHDKKIQTGGLANGSGGRQETSAGAALRCDGTGRTELPDEDKLFLRDIGRDADRIVAKLTACQAIVKADRVQINGWNEYGHPALQVSTSLQAR